MRSLVILLAGLFSFFYIDLSLFRRSTQGFLLGTTVTIELSESKEKLRRKQRKYKNRKFKKRPLYLQKHFKFDSTKSKDRRSSNQRDIRRMHTSYA